MESSTSSSSSSSTVVTNQKWTPPTIQIENPFTFKVGQVFTGFGIGCGLGIGVGRPLNLGAIPMLNQVMGATRGATDAFSGVGRHVNDSLKKLGAKNIEAGIGCGVGFGHGFGVGLALKPGVVHQVQSCLVQAMTKMMIKFGIAPNILPGSLQSGMNIMNEPSMQNPVGSMMQLATTVPNPTIQGQPGGGNLNMGSTYESFASKGTPLDTSFGNRTEKVISSFLQNPALREENTNRNELWGTLPLEKLKTLSAEQLQIFAGRLQSENSMLQMVLKHQQIIEELMEENEKLRQILVDDLKIPPSKLQASYSSSNRNQSPCTDCFECRRKQRKK